MSNPSTWPNNNLSEPPSLMNLSLKTFTIRTKRIRRQKRRSEVPKMSSLKRRLFLRSLRKLQKSLWNSYFIISSLPYIMLYILHVSSIFRSKPTTKNQHSGQPLTKKHWNWLMHRLWEVLGMKMDWFLAWTPSILRTRCCVGRSGDLCHNVNHTSHGQSTIKIIPVLFWPTEESLAIQQVHPQTDPKMGPTVLHQECGWPQAHSAAH